MIQFRCVNFEVFRDEAVRSLFTPAIAPLGEGSDDGFPPTATSTVAIPDDRLSSGCGRSIGEDRWVAIRPIEASRVGVCYVR